MTSPRGGGSDTRVVLMQGGERAQDQDDAISELGAPSVGF